MKEEIKKYLLNEKTGKSIPGRCLESHLIKKGYLDFIQNLYNDSESVKESIYRLINNIDIKPVCKTCGKTLVFKGSFLEFCDRSCANKHPDVLEKNKNNVSKALKNAYVERGEEIKLKRCNTLYEKYGVETNTPFGINEVNKKAKKTFYEKYTIGDKNVKSKSKKVFRELSVKLQKDRGYELEYVGDDYLVKKGCDIHGDIIIPQSVFNNRTKIDRIGKLCLICNPLNSNSSIEIFVKDILDEYNISYQMNTRKILNSKKELDFYIEDKNIAIECNGVYWHSEAKGENKLYHINKTQECEDLGISLIHLWEDEIKEKPEIIKSMLLNKLELTTHKIYARKCDIREISANDYTSFLNTHHIQGAMNSKVKLGLFNNDELCAVMGLGSLRISLGQKSKENVYELHRYAVKQNTNIIGGASKLFKYFIRNYEYEEIISYARRDYSKGNLYDKLGFTFVRNTEPNYFWVINSKRENRFKYRKSELPKIFKDIDLSKTEVEIMHEQGYYRIWDCGNKKYIYKK